MRKILFIIALHFLASAIFAQQAPVAAPKPCSASEAAQFDFWVGDWELTWNDTSHGSNKIEKLLGSCVLQENFDDPSTKYTGKSWSIYSPQRKLWQQTWVDNGGAYITLTGEFKDGKMTLATQPRTMQDGKKMISRMVYSNITQQSFDWIWEATTDDGKTWVANWKISYKRKKS